MLTLGMCAVSPQGLAGRDDDDFDYDDCGSIVIPSITQTSDVHCEVGDQQNNHLKIYHYHYPPLHCTA